MAFIDEIRRQLSDMGALERQQAIESLREVIYEDAYIQSRPTSLDMAACPRCGSVAVVRKGHDHDGAQRWLCRDCGRTFRMEPDTIITRSKLKPAVWMLYLECFVDCLPLRECAKRCRVSLRTSWLMRMRLIESLKRHLPDSSPTRARLSNWTKPTCARAPKATTRTESSGFRVPPGIAARQHPNAVSPGSRYAR